MGLTNRICRLGTRLNWNLKKENFISELQEPQIHLYLVSSIIRIIKLEYILFNKKIIKKPQIHLYLVNPTKESKEPHFNQKVIQQKVTEP